MWRAVAQQVIGENQPLRSFALETKLAILLAEARPVAISRLAVCVAVGILMATQSSAQSGSRHIPRVQIDAMFADMKARAPWDLNGKLLWGYFFIGRDKASLERAAKLLVGSGYTFVEIRHRETSDVGGEADWQLHVERVEHHTPDSLFARNEELYAFADRNGLVSYDGMDVGPVP